MGRMSLIVAITTRNMSLRRLSALTIPTKQSHGEIISFVCGQASSAQRVGSQRHIVSWIFIIPFQQRPLASQFLSVTADEINSSNDLGSRFKIHLSTLGLPTSPHRS
jgi:hypothetical protein